MVEKVVRCDICLLVADATNKLLPFVSVNKRFIRDNMVLEDAKRHICTNCLKDFAAIHNEVVAGKVKLS